jgi:hypothetical protein
VFTFIESAAFDRMRANYLDDDEYGELQDFLMLNPAAGVVVPRSGGVRKLRWARGGAGKRGGLRVIYCVRAERGEFWMLTLYSKTTRENAPAHILKKLKEAFEND